MVLDGEQWPDRPYCCAASRPQPRAGRPLAIPSRECRGCLAKTAEMISRGWGSTVWSDTHLTYMINIAMTTEFALEVVPGDSGSGHLVIHGGSRDQGGWGRCGGVL
jgi:hypothetical protein